MTLELLHVIRDNNIHLQGHQYQSCKSYKKHKVYIDYINKKYRIID